MVFHIFKKMYIEYYVTLVVYETKWCGVFFCRHSLVEGGLKLPSWWAADLFSRSRVMPDSISNTRQDFTFSTYTNAAT